MIVPIYKTILGPEFRQGMENVFKWLDLVLNQSEFVNRIGKVKFAEKPTFYLLPEPKEESKEPLFNSKTKVKPQKVANKKKE